MGNGWNKDQELVKVECVVVAQTDKAFLLKPVDYDCDQAWFPKEGDWVDWEEPANKGQAAVFYIAGWLLDKKGWRW